MDKRKVSNILFYISILLLIFGKGVVLNIIGVITITTSLILSLID